MAIINSKTRTQGQVFIIGAILVSITFLGAAVALNSVLYAENASADNQAFYTKNPAVQQMDTLERQYDTLVIRQNEKLNPNRNDFRSETSDTINELHSLEEQRQNSNARLTSIFATKEYGLVLRQDTSDEFTSANDTDTWQLVSSPAELKHGKITTNMSSLQTGSLGSLPLNPLRFNFSEGATSETYTIIYSGSSLLIIESGTIECSVSASGNASIDFINNTVDGEDCSTFESIDTNTNYTVTVENGSSGNGTYSFVTTGSPSDIGTELNSGPSSGEPYYANQILQINYQVEFISESQEMEMNPEYTTPIEAYSLGDNS